VVLSFFDQLYSCDISKGKFKVKLFYKALSNLDHEVFPWKSIWHTKVPSHVAFFKWTATLGKILTHDNLRKWNIVVVEWCYMCKKNGESVDHLLLHCEVASALWHFIFSWFGLHWVMPGRVKDLYASWWMGGCSWSAIVWKMIPLSYVVCMEQEECEMF
jgi:hypothetical protein